MKKKHSFQFAKIAVMAVLCIFSLSAFSQTLTIRGVVTDVQGEAIIGATIVIVGDEARGTVTDIDGNYTLPNVEETASLSFSYVGMTTQIIEVKGRSTINVVLSEDSELLDEVVVVAYGTQKKSTLTGALSTISTETLVKAPVASITNVLAGALPGVSTIQNSGQPGADAASIFIRGSGSLNNSLSRPLVLVDGVERDFTQIDPNEIENLSILKDASSTAVFGVRGANGVILITTRRGLVGKPSINVNSITGVQQPISYAKQTGSYEYARFWNMKMEADNVTDRSQYFTREAIELYRTGADPIMYSNMDWTDYIFNKAFLQTKNNINISGGSENVRYFVSLGYLFQNGILKKFDTLPYDNNYSYNRYNYRANLDLKLTETTSMKFNVGGNIGKRQEPNVIEDINNVWVYTTIWTVPMSGPGILNGQRTIVPYGFYPGEAVRDGLSGFYGYGYKQLYRTTLNMDLEVSQNLDVITKGLSASVKGAYDNDFTLNKRRGGGGIEYQTAYYKSYLDDKIKKQTDPDYDKTIVFVPTGKNSPLGYSESYGRDRNWYLEGRLNYTRRFGDHDVSGLILYNQSRNYYPTLPNGALASFQYIPRSYAGVVARATYSYKNKYLADINAGYNGSENFAPGKTRYGLFPAFSAGWVLSEEEFMKNLTFIDFLKLRASWGRVGSDLGTSTRFMYMESVWNPSGSYSFGVNNPTGMEAYGVGTPGNPNVTWETADKQNYGVDLNMLGNRLNINFDYFIEKRSGILISPQSTPAIIATSLPNLNIGQVNNRGYEVAVNWDEKLNNDFRYFIGGNISFARNKIIFMDEVPNPYSYMDITGGSTGRTTNMYDFVRLYQYSDFTKNNDGTLTLNPELPQPLVQVYPGDAMYKDLNGDGKVDGYDKMTGGYSERPEYMFGINGGFNYKGFNFSMQWTGAANVNKLMEIEYRIPFTNAGKRGLLQYFYDNSWTVENQENATLPRASETSESWNSETSTLWLRDARYLRLKTLTFGYTFAKKPFLRAIGAESLGISFTGYNLLTFSPLKEMDPESLTTNTGGYPLVKTYNLGLNINF